VALAAVKPYWPGRTLPRTVAVMFAPILAPTVALIAALSVAGCSELASSTEQVPAGGSNLANATAVVVRIKSLFNKDPANYKNFELSGQRWVHTLKGWSWLTCVRFQDHDHQRLYAVFVKDGSVVDDRYAVETDGCAIETYTPTDAGLDTARPMSFGITQPIY
jgi:hypothetical protein